jgi:hypothetical protein
MTQEGCVTYTTYHRRGVTYILTGGIQQITVMQKEFNKIEKEYKILLKRIIDVKITEYNKEELQIKQNTHYLLIDSKSNLLVKKQDDLNYYSNYYSYKKGIL